MAAQDNKDVLRLRLSSFMSEKQAPFFQDVLSYLSRLANVRLDLLAPCRPSLESLDVAWICGVSFATMDSPPLFTVLAVPQMEGCDAAQYFSKYIVKRNSAMYKFEDLRGCCLAANESSSWSGYLCIASQLHPARVDQYFGSVCFTGSHVASIEAVLQGEADCAAIDSMVLHNLPPSQLANLRVVGQEGPWPAPPFVVRCSLPHELIDALQSSLLEMHNDETGKQILARHKFVKFLYVADAEYSFMRSVVQKVNAI